MSDPAPAAVELALSALYLAPSQTRLAAVRQAAHSMQKAAPDDWAALGEGLESHGVLPLVRRNLLAAGVALPEPSAAAWSARTAALQEDARRFRLTLETTLAALSAADIRPTLLKGAALGLDLYPPEALRGMGDLDLMLEPSELRPALAACGAAGLVMGESSLPPWWYRLAHFHLKLRPSSSLLREVELHWALHHPALLLTVRAEDLRRRSVPVLGGRAWTLDPADRLLHLITHLASHASGERWASRADLMRVLSSGSHPLRLKWLLDVQAEVERLQGLLAPEVFCERVCEWRAASEVRWVLEWIDTALGFEPAAAEWVQALLAGAREPVVQRKVRDLQPGNGGPLAGLEFRATALRSFPRWLWPPDDYLVARTGSAGFLSRGAQTLRVLTCTALVGASLPVAVIARRLLRPGRRAAVRAASSPERILDQAVALRSL